MEQQIQRLKGELNEAKLKKDSIVIPKTGVHKGDRHTVIWDFGDGTYNIMPMTYKVKYRLGAVRAKASDLKLVKEDQLNENSIGEVYKVTSSIYDGMIKKTMSKLKKDIESALNSKLKGKVLDGLFDDDSGDIIKSPIKTVSVRLENDYDGYKLTTIFNHEDGNVTYKDDFPMPNIK